MDLIHISRDTVLNHILEVSRALYGIFYLFIRASRTLPEPVGFHLADLIIGAVVTVTVVLEGNMSGGQPGRILCFHLQTPPAALVQVLH